MMKRCLIFALLGCFLILFCACSQQELLTDKPASVTSTEAPTTPTTIETEDLSVNTELFADIGKTFAQLSEKYGEISLAFYDEGPVYYFENSTQFYSFDGFYEVEGGYDSLPLTEDGYWDLSAAPIPEEDDVCTGMYYVKASMVFDELAEPMADSELAALYQLGEPDSSQSLMTEQYIAAFEADGYRIRIICEDENYIIRPDVYVHIVPVQ